ncbi:MAG: phenylacetate--CoA ligase family protein [Candidatus Omnitrophica bacterium]|nr:phenylacetate--CoA ligase family protein [Candidatus Omnitrophota bacterium]
MKSMLKRDMYSEISALVNWYAAVDPRYADIALPITKREDLMRLPISSRKDLLSYGHTIPIREMVHVHATSGSTTQSIYVSVSPRAYEARKRRLARVFASAGLKPGDRVLNMFGYELNGAGRIVEQSLLSAGIGVIPVSGDTLEQRLERAVELVRMFKPVAINAYTGQLFDVLSRLDKGHSVKRCVASGEPLANAYRTMLEGSAGVEIHNMYAAVEFVVFGVSRAADDGYIRLFDDEAVFEVIDTAGRSLDEGKGDLLVTDPDNKAMPIIRYRLGDQVEIIRRADGRYIKVLGRTSESFLIRGAIYYVREISDVIEAVLKRPKFLVVIKKDLETYQDSVSLYLSQEDMASEKELRAALKRSFGFWQSVKILCRKEAFPTLPNGKLVRFLDAREKVS